MSKEVKKEIIPALSYQRSISQKAADNLAKIMGSWTFILIFVSFLIIWMIINSYILLIHATDAPWDPYPFILLNLVLSCLAAIQAPIILMSQNRQVQKDRIRAEYDYQVNRKAEREIGIITRQLDRIERKMETKRR
ncbi:cyclic nucleotide-binding protein [Candidatus Pacearchaeota archaeon CG10_big_fil_rev_8_21_14_0_10_31_24]|nr:MAG: cyclic nucleotide-binding protein [Candidatus Pacearchaeota archaeon CG10_big_fil_rev_8_21_14_0_10_31_24]